MDRIVTWTSKKGSASSINKQFAKKAKEMAKKGYEVTTITTVEAGRSKRSWLLLGILNFARGKQSQIVATFTLVPDAD